METKQQFSDGRWIAFGIGIGIVFPVVGILCLIELPGNYQRIFVDIVKFSLVSLAPILAIGRYFWRTKKSQTKAQSTEPKIDDQPSDK